LECFAVVNSTSCSSSSDCALCPYWFYTFLGNTFRRCSNCLREVLAYATI